MPATVLERLFLTERQRQRMARDGSLATPVLHEQEVPKDADPLLATSARSTFIRTRQGSDGVVRSGFSCVPLDREGELLAELYRVLKGMGWDNRFASVAEAKSEMAEPKLLVVSDAHLQEIGGGLSAEDTQKLMATRGYIVEVGGLKVLAGGLPAGAMVVGPPSQVGVYTRTGDYLSILVQRANRSILLVDE